MLQLELLLLHLMYDLYILGTTCIVYAMFFAPEKSMHRGAQ